MMGMASRLFYFDYIIICNAIRQVANLNYLAVAARSEHIVRAKHIQHDKLKA